MLYWLTVSADIVKALLAQVTLLAVNKTFALALASQLVAGIRQRQSAGHVAATVDATLRVVGLQVPMIWFALGTGAALHIGTARAQFTGWH